MSRTLASHTWSENDDFLAFFVALTLISRKELPINKIAVAARIGVGLEVLNMRVMNYISLYSTMGETQALGLRNSSIQTKRIFSENYGFGYGPLLARFNASMGLKSASKPIIRKRTLAKV